MKYTISEEVLNNILSVLAQLPYAKVTAIISEITEDVEPCDKEDVTFSES